MTKEFSKAPLLKVGRVGLLLAGMVPLMAFVFALAPFMADMNPVELVRSMAEGFQGAHLPLLAYWLGLLCLPGYIYAVVARSTARAPSPLRRRWVRLSLVVGSLCASVGLLALSYYIVAFVLAVVSAAYVLWDLEATSRLRSRA